MRLTSMMVIAAAFAVHGLGQSPSPNSQPTPGANASPAPPGPQRPSPSLPDVDTAGRRGSPFLTGRVMMQDGGTAPPDIVEIETLCNGRRSAAAAFTDSKGCFISRLRIRTRLPPQRDETLEHRSTDVTFALPCLDFDRA